MVKIVSDKNPAITATSYLAELRRADSNLGRLGRVDIQSFAIMDKFISPIIPKAPKTINAPVRTVREPFISVNNIATAPYFVLAIARIATHLLNLPT
jgi:hypothetical protein